MKWVKVFSSYKKAIEAISSNTSRLVVIGKHRICLSYIDGKFRAIQDACPHNGESLSKGKINYLEEVVCPWHGYRFSLKTGQESDQKCRDAKIYRTKVDDEGLFIFCS